MEGRMEGGGPCGVGEGPVVQLLLSGGGTLRVLGILLWRATSSHGKRRPGHDSYRCWANINNYLLHASLYLPARMPRMPL